jgi:hypothetical protein
MSRLIDDYQRLEDNEFYRMFIEKIESHRASRQNALESAEIELVPKIQGELLAIKWVLTRPKDMIDSILKEK